MCKRAFTSPVTVKHPGGTYNRHPTLALKVTQASTPSRWVPVWLCHENYDFTTLERRGRQRKKSSLHSFVNVCLKLLPDQSLAGINREHLRWGGGGEMGHGGVTGARCGEGRV